MKKGKKIRGLALCLACIFMLAGCSGGNLVVDYDMPEREITTITFFGNKYEPENVTVIEGILSDFMAQNPDVRVSYESLKGSAYYDALEKRMAAGKGDDVFMVNHDAVLQFEKKGYLADLSALSTIGDFTGEMYSQMVDDGKIYWIPTTVSAFGLYCNLDLLKAHKQKVPENLAEWKSVCDYFVSQSITPIIANNDISLKTLAIGQSFYEMYQKGEQSEVFAKLNAGQASLSEYLYPGFSLVEEFLEKGYIQREKALETEKTSDDLSEFVKGSSPFMLTGAWAAGRVAGMQPAFDFTVAPYPVLEEGALVVINADTRLSINENSEHPEAAKQFVEFFTKAENIRKFADQQSSFSPLKEGRPSTVTAIEPLIAPYQNGRTVIGTDGLLDLPIWDLTANVSKKLLAGEGLTETMAWLDQEAAKGREGN